MNKSRREFLKNSLLTTAGSLLIPNFLKACDTVPATSIKETAKKLIVIQLSGGNDGLNTIVPYRNDHYFKYRPTLAITPDKVLKATDDLGFHPALAKLNSLYDKGYLSILNNVGYPNPDRSHFRSMDIWHSASASDKYYHSGWIGRYLDATCLNCNTSHQAVEIDDTLSLALKGESKKGIAMANPRKLYNALHTDLVQSLNKSSLQHPIEDPTLHYLYRTIAESTSSADYIFNKTKTYQPSVEYPKNNLGYRLKTVAQLICAGVESKVYYVPFSGFDTHIRQAQQHERLLKTYAEAMEVFVRDLEQNNRFDEVVVMTFSEFGRRVAENGSGGTDHGTANNVFIIGKNLKKKGFLNGTPDLIKLDEGDLRYQVDFRSIYATLLDEWLEAPSKIILRGKFESLNFI